MTDKDKKELSPEEAVAIYNRLQNLPIVKEWEAANSVVFKHSYWNHDAPDRDPRFKEEKITKPNKLGGEFIITKPHLDVRQVEVVENPEETDYWKRKTHYEMAIVTTGWQGAYSYCDKEGKKPTCSLCQHFDTVEECVAALAKSIKRTELGLKGFCCSKCKYATRNTEPEKNFEGKETYYYTCHKNPEKLETRCWEGHICEDYKDKESEEK